MGLPRILHGAIAQRTLTDGRLDTRGQKQSFREYWHAGMTAWIGICRSGKPHNGRSRRIHWRASRGGQIGIKTSGNGSCSLVIPSFIGIEPAVVVRIAAYKRGIKVVGRIVGGSIVIANRYRSKCRVAGVGYDICKRGNRSDG